MTYLIGLVKHIGYLLTFRHSGEHLPKMYNYAVVSHIVLMFLLMGMVRHVWLGGLPVGATWVALVLYMGALFLALPKCLLGTLLISSGIDGLVVVTLWLTSEPLGFYPRLLFQLWEIAAITVLGVRMYRR